MIEKNKITEKIPNFLWFGEETFLVESYTIPATLQVVKKDGCPRLNKLFEGVKPLCTPFFSPGRKLQELPWGRELNEGWYI